MAKIALPYLGEIFQSLPRSHFIQCGVYFLHYEGEVVYVGQAANMMQRIGQHMAEGKKLFDSVSCLPCQPSKLTANERYYIAKLTPLYNRCSVAKEAKVLVESGLSGHSTLALPAFVDADVAASMLGIPKDEFFIIRHKIASVKKRIPRTNIKRRLYDTQSIRSFGATREAV